MTEKDHITQKEIISPKRTKLQVSKKIEIQLWKVIKKI